MSASDEYFSLSGSTEVSFISCSKEFTPNAEEDRISGPISCLASRGAEFVYVVDQSESMDKLPLDCMVISTDGEIGDPGRYNRQDPFNSAVDSFFHSSEVSMVLYQCYEQEPGQSSDCTKSQFCLKCEQQDKQCGLDLKRDACCINVGHKHLEIVCPHVPSSGYEEKLKCFKIYGELLAFLSRLGSTLGVYGKGEGIFFVECSARGIVGVFSKFDWYKILDFGNLANIRSGVSVVDSLAWDQLSEYQLVSM
ncbi:hypothetical protein IHE45_17G115300 [Dioscorea alata]|uniref:Uncharacterized protein n=1 Tax=Dioscorea alata TaxID=55571 RepID=A0ACB7UEW1_DIOAL|nr:hypothetical protein IHE45_17G115300 [Dioscorea alata]